MRCRWFVLLICCAFAGCTANRVVPIPERTAVVPILMYHHINDLPPETDEVMRTWSVSTRAFSDQMNWLVEHGYHSITLDALAAHLTTGQPLPQKPIVITFDDGWDIGYGVAFPVLKKLHLTGTFFVCPPSIGEQPGSGYMTWSQLREMLAAGMDVQSHTMGHPHLRGLSSENQWREIAESKAKLEEKLGISINALAYPFGEFDESLMQMARRAGYACAVGIEPGYTQRTSEIYGLRRIRISYGDTLDTFKEQVTKP